MTMVRRHLCILLTIVWGCSGNELPPNTAPTGSAMIRLVHAAPGAPAVDVYITQESNAVFGNVAYEEVSFYREVENGTFQFSFRATGSAVDSTPIFVSEPLTFPDGLQSTLVVAGMADGTGSDALRLLRFDESFGDGQTGKARIRLVNTVLGTNDVDIDVNGDSAADIRDLTRYADAGAVGVLVDSGSSSVLGVTVDGVTTDFSVNALTEQTDYFAVLTGSVADGAADIPRIVVADPIERVQLANPSPTLYFLHASSDGPAVDLFAGDLQLADNLEFGGLSGPISVPVASYDIEVFAHEAGSARPSGTPLVNQSIGAVAPAFKYLVTVTGFVNGSETRPEIGVSSIFEQFAPNATGGVVRVLHAAHGTGAIDVSTVSFPPALDTPVLLSDFTLDEDEGDTGLTVSTGTQTIGIAVPTGTSNAFARFPLTIPDETRGIWVLMGTLVPQMGDQAITMAVIETSVNPWTVTLVPGE